MRQILGLFGLVGTLTLLSACGGGGGDGASAGSDSTSSNTISGIVTYSSYKPSSSSGLDYGTSQENPIRGAVVELQNSSGTVLASGNTTATGNYSLSAPANTSVRVVVKAALGSSSTPDTQIVDNTSGAALYAMAMDVTSATSDISQSFNAGSGWDGSSYSGTRTAAPFAILDVIYQAQQLVKTADSNASFPELLVNWSTNNKPASGELTVGEISTSHYNSNGQLYILGAENSDTDEYDTHVIAHEWGHYFEAKFSRSDNIGGDHGGGDILDPTVAFGEGFGNALSGMVMNDPLYIDTAGQSQATVSNSMNLEADSISDDTTDITIGTGQTNTFLDGFYSESSVQEVLYDLYDSGASDDDAVAGGFAPIYSVLVNGQKSTKAFTSIFSFLYHLKQDYPSYSAGISSIALAENISDGDEYEATTRPIYTTVPFDGSSVTVDVDGATLQTWTSYGPITASSAGNKLYNLLYFKTTATASGCYTLEAKPSASEDLIIYAPDGVTIDQNIGGSESVSGTFTLGENSVFAVGSYGGATLFSVRLYSSPSSC